MFDDGVEEGSCFRCELSVKFIDKSVGHGDTYCRVFVDTLRGPRLSSTEYVSLEGEAAFGRLLYRKASIRQ